MLTAEYLREVLHYDPITGAFTWRVCLGARALVGSVAAKRPKDSDRYRAIRIAGKLYAAHRLAFFYMTGEWPSVQVDHRDGDRSNNRWVNIRQATNAENMQNKRKPRCDNTSGYLGVYPRGCRWAAEIMAEGKKHRFGTFDTPEAAHAAYLKAKKVLHPFVSCDTIQTHCNQKGKDVFSITLEFETLEQAITALATLRNPETAPKPEAKADKEPASKKSATTAKPAAGSQDAAAGPAPAPEKKVQESSASATVDAYEPVGALIKKLAATHRAQVLATLGEFGAANGKELKPDQYAAFIEKLTAATSGELA